MPGRNGFGGNGGPGGGFGGAGGGGRSGGPGGAGGMGGSRSGGMNERPGSNAGPRSGGMGGPSGPSPRGGGRPAEMRPEPRPEPRAPRPGPAPRPAPRRAPMPGPRRDYGVQFLPHRRPVPHGLVAYFTEIMQMREARRILIRLVNGEYLTDREYYYLEQVFGSNITDPYVANDLIAWLDEELGAY